jgi:hypothetical protein
MENGEAVLWGEIVYQERYAACSLRCANLGLPLVVVSGFAPHK